jgi:hypothetical protein
MTAIRTVWNPARNDRKERYVTRIAHRRPATGVSVLGVVAALLLSVFAATAVGGSGSGASASETLKPLEATIYMKADKKGLRFVAPDTIAAGASLEVVNQSDPRKFGPHTFSLVTKGSLPKTPNARKLCFAKGHICRAIARWHGVKGNGPVKVNPAEAGLPGWDTLGNNTREGDSWFSGNKPGGSFTQPVSVDVAAGPTRIYFLCAIHPWMQGSSEIVPAPGPSAG